MNKQPMSAVGNGSVQPSAAAPSGSYNTGATAFSATGNSAPPPIDLVAAAHAAPPRDRLRRLQVMEDEPFIAPDELAAANARHDAEHVDPFAWERSRVKSSWLRGHSWRR